MIFEPATGESIFFPGRSLGRPEGDGAHQQGGVPVHAGLPAQPGNALIRFFAPGVAPDARMRGLRVEGCHGVGRSYGNYKGYLLLNECSEILGVDVCSSA